MTNNEKIIQCFKHCIQKNNQEKSKGYQFKNKSFSKAIQILEKMDPITNSKQIEGYPGIGKGILQRIREILDTGTLEEIQSIQNEPKNSNESDEKQIEYLKRISGVGDVKAKQILERGYTLDSLLRDYAMNKDSIDFLTHHQRLGVKHFYDTEKRIPYKEIQEFEKILQSFQIFKSQEAHFIICGSYRRKKETSGDIDVLLFSKNKKKDGALLTKLCSILNTYGMLIDDLTDYTKLNVTKYMGYCKLGNNPVRRLDIRCIDWEHVPSAMLYFTGSGEFNRSMRIFAQKQGYKLNEYGLWKSKQKIEGLTSEEKIFQYLKLPYIEPKDRLPSYIFKIET